MAGSPDPRAAPDGSVIAAALNAGASGAVGEGRAKPDANATSTIVGRPPLTRFGVVMGADGRASAGHRPEVVHKPLVG